MKRQGGQGLVELAVVLPFFLGIVFGCIFFGMVFADYVALNSIASRAAREASLIQEEEKIIDNYSDVRARFSTQELPSQLYKWDYKKIDDFSLTFEEKTNAAVIIVKAQMDEQNDMCKAFTGVMPDVMIDSLKELKVEYRMYSEYEPKQDKST